MGSSGVKNDALASYGTNQGAATSALSAASPIYQRLASGTQGLTPQQMADARSGIMATQGGTQSAATGAADLLAARTGNVGGLPLALDDAARTGGVRAEDANLQVQNESDQIARANQAEGLSGLSSIYGTATQGANANLNTANNAAQPFWKQALLQGIKGAAQGATMGA